MRSTAAILLVVALLVLPACQMNERMSGTVFGAVGGGVVGGAVGGAGGAIVGVLAGGVAGYLVGDYMADRRERGRSEVFETGSAAATPTAQPQPAVMGVKAYARAPAAPAVDRTGARAAYEHGRAALTAPEARAYFQESIRLDPSRPEAWNALGLNALYRGDGARAEYLWTKALERDPSYYPARHNLDRYRAQGLQRP